ncbi:S-methyl-5'-thioadenosine phosphorylase [bacterium]|jgi:5'-methylthioadenosine phosphorylase|nr:S-methyl-5'-thioadenosine phosphorylase [bacterium]
MKLLENSQSESASIGIFGGSGFYSLLDNVREVTVETPYGPTSDKIALAERNGKKVAFLPRHGKNHTIPPHKINYRANMWAMKALGVKFIISPSAAGSLQKNIEPGHFVVVDQFVDRTTGRVDTFYDGPAVTHMSFANPYSDYLRTVASDSIKKTGVVCHDSGTVVVIQGPRFSSKAESKWFSEQGWEVVNMTQYPEVVLAKELEMAFVNISLITDYDSGVDGVKKPDSVEDILSVFGQNIENIKKSILFMIDLIDVEKDCDAHNALSFSRF